MKNIHKHYPNPTIIEAVIELRLDKSMKPKDNEHIEKTFGSKYQLKKDELLIYKASFNSSGMSLQHDKPGQFRLRFNISEQMFVQIYPDRFSFHWVGKYPGWVIFQAEFEQFWNHLFELLPDFKCLLLGTRFINKLDQKTKDQKVGFWLKSSPNYPKNILDVSSDYFYRSKWPIAPDRWVQICIAESEISNHFRPLMFDIDIIQQINKPFELNSSLSEIAKDLHDEVYGIFESSISSNYKKVLNLKYRL